MKTLKYTIKSGSLRPRNFVAGAVQRTFLACLRKSRCSRLALPGRRDRKPGLAAAPASPRAGLLDGAPAGIAAWESVSMAWEQGQPQGGSCLWNEHAVHLTLRNRFLRV